MELRIIRNIIVIIILCIVNDYGINRCNLSLPNSAKKILKSERGSGLSVPPAADNVLKDSVSENPIAAVVSEKSNSGTVRGKTDGSLGQAPRGGGSNGFDIQAPSPAMELSPFRPQ